MKRLNWATLLLLAAVLIGCGGSYHEKEAALQARQGATRTDTRPLHMVDGTSSGAVLNMGQSQSSSGQISADGSHALDPATLALFQNRDSGLPALPDDSGARGVSDVGREWQDGSAFFDKSPNAAVTASSLSLFTGAGQRNWAIYQLSDVSGALGLSSLEVECSNTNFAGEQPGYYVGLANFNTGRWEILARSESDTYAKTLTSFDEYKSAANNIYVFVLSHDGNGVQLDRVGFDVDRDPPLVTEVSPSSGASDAQIQPVATISGLVDSYSWDFGGGAVPNTSTEASPLITLGLEGNYNASLTATSVFGEHVFDFILEVGPVSGSIPEIISVSPLTGETLAVVDFSAVVNGTVDTYAWDFGGAGTPNTSTDAAPQVTLGAVGTYDCSLTATNGFGFDTFDFSFEVTAIAGEAPVIVSVTPLSGDSGADVSFVPTFTGTVDTWDWQFGAGAAPTSSTDESPAETLGAPGTYPCSVTATNAFGNDTLNFDLQVNSTVVTYEWTEVDLSSITGTEGGWTPSVAIANNGNPMVAYANLDAAVLDPYVVIGDSALDLTVPANWTALEIADLALTFPGASPAYTDIVIMEGSNLPRVSYNLLDLTGATAAENSRVAFSALDIYEEVPTWNSYFLGNEAVPSVHLDGAFSTTIDVRPTDSAFGISTTVANANLPALAADQTYYYAITYDWENPGTVSYNLTRFTGGGLLFPRGRYHASGEYQFNVNGGDLVRENGGAWAYAFNDPLTTTVLGSLDLFPGGNTGMSYCQVAGTDFSLHYTELDPANLEVTNENIHTVTDSGAGENVATISQLSYMADGTACIVFTEHNGTSTMVRFAMQDGLGGWTIEDVSSSPNTFTAAAFDVWCDLAHFANGNSIVCYSRFDNDVNTLRVVLRAPTV